MPEQTFRSPNFFEREIDLSAPTPAVPTGVPGGVIGTANKGPAFVPVTVGNFDEFVSKFGNLDPKKYGPYAVNEFLKNKSALTYLRVLGAGANASESDIEETIASGRVKNAGMLLSGVAAPHDNLERHSGVMGGCNAMTTLRGTQASSSSLWHSTILMLQMRASFRCSPTTIPSSQTTVLSAAC